MRWLSWAAAGMLLALPFLGNALEPLVLLAPLPWIVLAAGEPSPRFRETWLGSAAFVACGLWWLSHVHPVSVLACALHFGLYPAAGAWALSRLRAAGWPLVLAAPLCVMAYEALLLRACLFETSWLSFGTLAWRATPLAQVASAGGTPLLSALMWAVPAALAGAFLDVRRDGESALRRARTWIPLAAASVALVAAWLLGRAAVPPMSAEPLLRVALVQGNIPQDLRVRPAETDAIVQKHAVMTLRDVPPGAQLVAWPESTASLALEQDAEARQFLGMVSARVRAPLLLGAIGTNEGGPPSNSAFLVDAAGEILGRSDKRYLVPGAETLLFLDRIPAIRDPLGSFLSRTMHFRPYLLPGRGPVVLEASGVRFGVLICYDDVVPGPSEELHAAGAQALITITNEAWFGPDELRQHVAMAVFRCIETRLPMARAGNDGLTCLIDPAGRVTRALPAWNEGVLAGELSSTPARPVPPLARALVAWGAVAVVAAGLVVPRLRRRGSEAA